MIKYGDLVRWKCQKCGCEVVGTVHAHKEELEKSATPICESHTHDLEIIEDDWIKLKGREV